MRKKIVLFILMFLGSHFLLIFIGMNTGLKGWSQKFVIQQGIEWSQPYLEEVGEMRWLPLKASNHEHQHNVQILFATHKMITEMQTSGHAVIDIEGHSFNSWTELLMPNLFLLALFIATPIAVRRKILAYGIAFLLLNFLLSLRLGLYVHYVYSIYVDAASVFDTILRHPASIVIRHQWLSTTGAFFLWIMTAFRSSDFNHFFQLD